MPVDPDRNEGPVEAIATLFGIALWSVWAVAVAFLVAAGVLAVVGFALLVAWLISPWLFFFIVAPFAAWGFAAIARRLGI